MNITRKYVLDLTDAKLPKWWKKSWGLRIPIVVGVHRKDWDIDTSRMDAAIYAEMVDTVKAKVANLSGYNCDWPIGMDYANLPPGYKILEASE